MVADDPSITLYTAGHGDRSLAELVAVLAVAGVERVADVRSYPSSRRHPQFGKTTREAGAKGRVNPATLQPRGSASS